MAINYAVKYATKIAEAFSKPSITDDDAGKAYTWTGPNSKTIVVGSVDTVPETEYTNTGDNRFGTTYDLGDTQQEMTCEQKPAFSFTIDAVDQTDRPLRSPLPAPCGVSWSSGPPPTWTATASRSG